MENNRAKKTIKLSNCEVDIVESITWGEKERIQQVFLKSAKIGNNGVKELNLSPMFEAKLKLMEIAILEIREGDKKIQYTNEWAENLSPEDGDTLFDALDAIGKKK